MNREPAEATQTPEQPTAPPPECDSVVIAPVFVLSRAFPARPSSIPDAHTFVRETFVAADVPAAPHAQITEAINTALLTAAGPDVGTFVVVIRLFPHDAELEVLSAADAALAGIADAPLPAAESFASWLADMLRKEGLSQEAAARQIGVSVRTVSRWVRGQTEPRLRDVRRISEVLGPVPHR